MDWLPLISYVLIATFTPGPNNIMSTANAARDGFRRTLPFLAGILCGTLALFSLCAALVLALGSLLPGAVFWLNLGGTLYMLALGVLIMASGPHSNGSRVNLNSFAAGFGLTFINVKVIIYGFTVFAAFVIGVYRQPLALGAFALGMSATCFASVCLWAAAGHLLRALFERHYRIINLILGGILAVMALWNLWKLLG